MYIYDHLCTSSLPKLVSHINLGRTNASMSGQPVVFSFRAVSWVFEDAMV